MSIDNAASRVSLQANQRANQTVSESESVAVPSKHDFLEDHGALDAVEAWKNFGGLTIEEAYRKLSDRPEIHFEDFMHMGESAFAHYYCVIDRFVREAISNRDTQRTFHLWIAAHSTKFHFDPVDSAAVQEIRSKVLDLCDFVETGLPDLNWHSADVQPYTQAEVEEAWKELRRVVTSTTT